MKVHTEYKSIPAPVINYPCLLRKKGDCLVVLFTAPNLGTVVQPNEQHFLGEFSIFWDVSDFEKANVTVTLSDTV